MIGQKLKLKQHLKLLPQQIMLMKLIQTPAMALEETIKEEIEKNPVLEEAEEEDKEDNTPFEDPEKEDVLADLNEYYNEDEYNLPSERHGGDKDTLPVFSAFEENIQEFLITQLGWLDLSETEYCIGMEIIGNLDDAGYLARTPKALANDLILRYNLFVSEEEIMHILKQIQQFDPSGIGAQNLQDCLLIQLQRIKPQDQITQLGIQIIENAFDLFTKKHYDKIMHRFHISKEELSQAIDLIVKLNPKPSSNFASHSGKKSQYIIPDFYLLNQNGEIEFSTNNAHTPNLQLNKYYLGIIQKMDTPRKLSKAEKETIQFIKKQVDSAKWFIDAVKQRQLTLHTIFSAIVSYQYDFFLNGDINLLKPMRLKDIALVTHYDISTISRVVTQKYVQTHFGTFLLKDFFSTSYTNEQGDDVTTDIIKQTLLESIENEDKTNPLTDEELTLIMKEKGYPVARRTIAKYRELLKIPVARLRKNI